MILPLTMAEQDKGGNKYLTPPPNVLILKFASLSNVNHNQNIISIQIFYPIFVDQNRFQVVTNEPITTMYEPCHVHIYKERQ